MIGEKLQKLRKEKKLSLRALAEKSKISKSTLSDIENGKTNPTTITLEKIANALEINVEELFKSKEKLNGDVKYSHINEESETYECTNSILNKNDTSLTCIINKTTDVKEIMELILSQPFLTLNGKILNDESKIALENAIKMALAYAEQKQKEDDPKNK